MIKVHIDEKLYIDYSDEIRIGILKGIYNKINQLQRLVASRDKRLCIEKVNVAPGDVIVDSITLRFSDNNGAGYRFDIEHPFSLWGIARDWEGGESGKSLSQLKLDYGFGSTREEVRQSLLNYRARGA